MKRIKLFFVLAIAATFLFQSCTKEGPAGPAGATGATGAQGPTGPAGPASNGGVSSASITTSNWSYISPSWVLTLTYSVITQDILDNGAVFVYNKVGTSYFQLPYTLYPTSSYSRTADFEHYVGGLKIFVTDSDLTQPVNPGTQTFKVVVIDGTAKNPNVNYNDYNSVKAYYGLVD